MPKIAKLLKYYQIGMLMIELIQPFSFLTVGFKAKTSFQVVFCFYQPL